MITQHILQSILTSPLPSEHKIAAISAVVAGIKAGNDACDDAQERRAIRFSTIATELFDSLAPTLREIFSKPAPRTRPALTIGQVPPPLSSGVIPSEIIELMGITRGPTTVLYWDPTVKRKAANHGQVTLQEGHVTVEAADATAITIPLEQVIEVHHDPTRTMLARCWREGYDLDPAVDTTDLDKVPGNRYWTRTALRHARFLRSHPHGARFDLHTALGNYKDLPIGLDNDTETLFLPDDPQIPIGLQIPLDAVVKIVFRPTLLSDSCSGLNSCA